MQIIIVQAEIEEAICNHIASRLRVAEGMQMDIELNATRGAEGFKAVINITPNAQHASSPSSVYAEPAPAPTYSAAPASAPIQPQAAVETAAPRFGASPLSFSADEAQSEDVRPAPFAVVQAAAAAVAAQEESEALGSESEEVAKTQAGRSLFKGLKKVTNS